MPAQTMHVRQLLDVREHSWIVMTTMPALLRDAPAARVQMTQLRLATIIISVPRMVVALPQDAHSLHLIVMTMTLAQPMIALPHQDVQILQSIVTTTMTVQLM